MRVYVGIDIGGTKMFGGLITEKGDILRTKEVPSHAQEGNAAILKSAVELLSSLRNGYHFHGIGFGIAGHIDHVNNCIADHGPNFLPTFKQLDLVPKLWKIFKVPVVLENDAKVYALGEAAFGRGKGYRRVLVVTLGTGIGGGLIQDSQIVHGKNNLTGEIGQMFTHGHIRTWERLAAGGPFNRHGNIKKEANFLAEGFHNLLNVIDPDIIVVGGGVSRVPGLIAAARTVTRERLHYEALKKTPIVKSALLAKAPILGAMLIARGA